MRTKVREPVLFKVTICAMVESNYFIFWVSVVYFYKAIKCLSATMLHFF